MINDRHTLRATDTEIFHSKPCVDSFQTSDKQTALKHAMINGL